MKIFSFVATLMIFPNGICIGQNSQEEVVGFKGVSVDLFPLIDNLFSDENSLSKFPIRYIWGKGHRQFEIGFVPSFTNIDAEVSTSNTNWGLDSEIFIGHRTEIQNRWQSVMGIKAGYKFRKQSSESNGFEFNIKSHTAQLGPRYIFGYKISRRILLRTYLEALVQYTDDISDVRNFNNPDFRSIKSWSFSVRSPQSLELVMLF